VAVLQVAIRFGTTHRPAIEPLRFWSNSLKHELQEFYPLVCQL